MCTSNASRFACNYLPTSFRPTLLNLTRSRFYTNICFSQKKKKKNTKKSSQHISQIIIHWRLLLLIFFCSLHIIDSSSHFLSFLLNYESIFELQSSSNKLYWFSFSAFLCSLSSFHLPHCDRHTREGGKALIWLLCFCSSWGYVGFWSVARLPELELLPYTCRPRRKPCPPGGFVGHFLWSRQAGGSH